VRWMGCATLEVVPGTMLQNARGSAAMCSGLRCGMVVFLWSQVPARAPGVTPGPSVPPTRRLTLAGWMPPMSSTTATPLTALRVLLAAAYSRQPRVSRPQPGPPRMQRLQTLNQRSIPRNRSGNLPVPGDGTLLFGRGSRPPWVQWGNLNPDGCQRGSGLVRFQGGSQQERGSSPLHSPRPFGKAKMGVAAGHWEKGGCSTWQSPS